MKIIFLIFVSIFTLTYATPATEEERSCKISIDFGIEQQRLLRKYLDLRSEAYIIHMHADGLMIAADSIKRNCSFRDDSSLMSDMAYAIANKAKSDNKLK